MREQSLRWIREKGQFVAGSFGGADGPDVAYTIGNHERELPELLVFASPTEVAALLYELGERMRAAGRPFADGELVDCGGRHPLKAVTAQPAAADWARQALEHYGVDAETLRITQLLLPDGRGRFPGDPGCRPPFSEQPVLARH